jgi:hypothetical protein
MGAATRSEVRSDAVIQAVPESLACAYLVCQRPCTNGGGVRDEEAGSSNLPTPSLSTAGQPLAGGLRFLFRCTLGRPSPRRISPAPVTTTRSRPSEGQERKDALAVPPLVV